MSCSSWEPRVGLHTVGKPHAHAPTAHGPHQLRRTHVVPAEHQPRQPPQARPQPGGERVTRDRVVDAGSQREHHATDQQTGQRSANQCQVSVSDTVTIRADSSTTTPPSTCTVRVRTPA